jgi:hypothetical protein
VALADRRQRFDAKEESIEKRRHLGNAVRVQHVQCSKDKIDKEVDTKNYAGESRPAQGQDQMVRISPIERLGIELHKFKLTGPGPDQDALSRSGLKPRPVSRSNFVADFS